MSKLGCVSLLMALCLLAVACGPNLGTPAATEAPASSDRAPAPATPTLQSQEPEVEVDLSNVFESSTPPPALTVEEYPIVAAEVDGPGHLEYMDRLGEETLTRVQGLRGYFAERQLARSNAALAPFGYHLQAHFDPEWNRMFYDLFQDDEAEPLVPRLSRVWPVSVNASGTDFVFAAENAPNTLPLYLLVSADGIRAWDDGEQSNWLPPVYVGHALARITSTGYPTITYQVQMDNQATYTGTAAAYFAYMPLRSFTSWEGHWVLGVDDHLIVDGQDLNQVMGYDAAFGFSLLYGLPFYFFEQDGDVHISYAGQTLPNIYDEVVHNQCCEASMFNVEAHDDVVLFHALWDGTWHFVEAGMYARRYGEMASTYRYTAPEGWSFRYPAHWDRLDPEVGLVQERATGKTVTFASAPTSQVELERWLESEIARKLDATEGENTLAESLSVTQEVDLAVYRYAILSQMEASQTLLRTTVLFDGQRRYEFSAAIPPVAEEEYEAILASFRPAD